MKNIPLSLALVLLLSVLPASPVSARKKGPDVKEALKGEVLLLLAGDRHMGVDSAVSKRVTLKKGRNILRGATINGPGMSEFCARFIDDSGAPVRNYTISCE